jgi:hypothetical protein
VRGKLFDGRGQQSREKIISVFRRSKKPSQAALSSENPLLDIEQTNFASAMRANQPGHLQWPPRSECTRGRSPLTAISAMAASNIVLTDSAFGRVPIDQLATS